MIVRYVELHCGEEHGTGNQVFPSPDSGERFTSVKLLRRAAKKAGWSRSQREDYCDICTEMEKERR